MRYTREIPQWSMGGGRLAIWVALGVVLTLTALELTARVGRGYAPDNGFKVAREWSAHLSASHEELLVLGDSRVAWGVDCAGVDQGVFETYGPPGRCRNGAVIWGRLPEILEALVDAEITPAGIAVALSPASLYSPAFAREFAPIHAGFERLGLVARIDALLRNRVRRHLVIGEVKLRVVVDMLLGRHVQRTRYLQTDEGWNGMYLPESLRPESKKFQIEAYGKQFLRPLDAAGTPVPEGHFDEYDMIKAEARVVAALDTLARRGSRLTFFRMPVGPQIDALEKQLGLAQRLPAIAEAARGKYRDFNGPGYPVADESHMSHEQATPFSRELGRWIGESL
ncbi:MAG: hypothetical protein ACE366_01575 [Bradymonadia bacterium]